MINLKFRQQRRVVLLLVCVLVVVAVVVPLSSLLTAVHAKHVHRDGPYAAAARQHRQQAVQELALLDPYQPQQVLTSLGGDVHAARRARSAVDGKMDAADAASYVVSWVTMAMTTTPVLEWSFTSQANTSSPSYTQIAADATAWTDPTPAHTIRIVYTATMAAIPAATKVYYRVGDVKTNTFSEEYEFTSMPPSSDPIRMIVYGDMGLVNSVSMQNVLNEVMAGEADLVLHVGDFAYDLHTDNGTWGDVFFNDIMPISTRVPYVGCEGNHEGKYNSTHYTQRFAAYNALGASSGTNNNWWFSWNYMSGDALVHMVAIDTEVYFVYVDENAPPDLTPQREAQYAWLDADLTQARTMGADWIIVYGHRPMYCSDTDGLTDCTNDTRTLREGINGEWGMEEVLHRHSVDLYISGHEHSYERIYPVYKGVPEKQGFNVYTGWNSTAHIVSGSAGCQEDLDTFDDVFFGAYSAFRNASYGYGHLIVYNTTHLYWNQLLNEGAQGLDELWMIRAPSSSAGEAEAEAIDVIEM